MTAKRWLQQMSARLRVLLVAIATLAFALPASGERWYVLSSGNFDARQAFDVDSIAQAPGFPTALTLRVYVHVGIGTFECSPPSDCIATSQLTDYYVDCARMVAAEIRRVPMNLRDKVIAVIDAPYPAWVSLAPVRVYYDRDEGRVVAEALWLDSPHGEVRAFCTLLNAGRLHEVLGWGPPMR